jgi:hypothetical protein
VQPERNALAHQPALGRKTVASARLIGKSTPGAEGRFLGR